MQLVTHAIVCNLHETDLEFYLTKDSFKLTLKTGI